MHTVISPVNQSGRTELTDSFDAKDIIRLYQTQLNMDVSHYFRHTPQFYLYKCTDTGYRFYHPKGLDGDGPFYELLQNRLGDGYYHDWKFENQLAFDQLQENDRVLDIGCGVGKFLERAREKTKQVVGLELNEKAVGVCREKGLTVYNELIQDHAVKNPEAYDMVCYFQVLEHIYDVKEFITESLKVLKPGGKLVIGVPNSEPYFLGYDKYCTLNLPPHHMGLWNRSVFEKLAPLFNLRIDKVIYDEKGTIIREAYLRAKYMAGITTLAGRHSITEKIKMAFTGLIALPLTILKKLGPGINGSHIAVLFTKQ